MKLKAKNRKKLSAIRKTLLLGLPISSLMAGGCDNASAGEARLSGDIARPMPDDHASTCVRDTSRRENGNDPAKQNVPAKKTFSINPMSLFHRRYSTAGMVIPPPIKVEAQEYEVKSGDTWESLGKRFGLEILLRINGVRAEKTYEILESGKVPDDLKLVPGQKIFVPVNIVRDRYDSEGERCP